MTPLSPETYEYAPTGPLATGATITVPYKAASRSGDYAQTGHSATVHGGAYAIAPTFGATSFSFPWTGPALRGVGGRVIRLQLARAERAVFPDAAPDIVASSTYTLVAADKGRIKEFTGACVITLPNSLEVGFSCLLLQASASAVSISAGAGATLRQKDAHTSLGGQWSEVSVRVRANPGGAAAEYVASGALA